MLWRGISGSLAAVLLLAVQAGPALTATPRTETGPRLAVVTTIAQIAEPLRVIVGDRAGVVNLMGEGVDPHLYRPTRSDMVTLTRADVIFWNGLDLELQMQEALERLGETRPVVAVAEALTAQALLTAGSASGKARDPHVWMDPALWRDAIAHAVAVLKQVDPAGAAGFDRRAAQYFQALAEMDAYAVGATASIPPDARILITAHDAFGYFGRRYGIEVIGVQGLSTESEAGLRKIESMVDILVARDTPAVFVETSVSERNMRALIEGAAAAGRVVRIGGRLFSDAMGPPGSYEGTYLGMIDHNVTTIARALGGTAPAGGRLGRLTHVE